MGTHCDHSFCNQKDFLPFRCDICSMNLCLEHRSYEAHDCLGRLAKDMTSIDCPVCGKGIKFSKLDDPNVFWDTHYATECSQKGRSALDSVQKVAKCAAKECHNKLGPSNTFGCTKCHKSYCSTHRIPEDHMCKIVRADIPLAQSGANKQHPTNKNNFALKGKKSGVNVDSTNTLRGSAARRIKQENVRATEPKESSPSEKNLSLKCPICSTVLADLETLEIHVNYEHLHEPAPPRSPNRVIDHPIRSQPPASGPESAHYEVSGNCTSSAA